MYYVQRKRKRRLKVLPDDKKTYKKCERVFDAQYEPRHFCRKQRATGKFLGYFYERNMIMKNFDIDANLRPTMIEMIEMIHETTAAGHHIRIDLEPSEKQPYYVYLKSKGFLKLKQEPSTDMPQAITPQTLPVRMRAENEIVGLKGEWSEFLEDLKRQEKEKAGIFGLADDGS